MNTSSNDSNVNGHQAHHPTSGAGDFHPQREPQHPRLGQSGQFVPELAGVCSYAEAHRPGLGVDENVAWLKRLNWVETRLNDLFLTRLNATPEWEVKGAFAHHVWLDAEHAKWLRERVAELRHPPHRFDAAPDERLEAWLQEALRSRGTLELLAAIYRVIKPALLEAYRAHRERTHPLVDQPTLRLTRFIVLEEEEMIAWGETALQALLCVASMEERVQVQAWEEHLHAYLNAAGGVLGDGERLQSELPPSRVIDEPELHIDWTPRRDGRLQSHNYNFPPHWVYAQRERPAKERMLALVCKRLLEMDVPEMMAAIIYQGREDALKNGHPKSWTYTSDMCRQVWDEARHSMMGEAWLASRGIDWTGVPLNVGFSLALNTLATPREAHAALYWIEQGLMPRQSGKGYEWDVASQSGDELAKLFMDYDWADEVLHVHIGRHIIDEVGGRKEAERLGKDAFARVMELRRQQQEHDEQNAPQAEWWPQFCRRAIGLDPQPLDEQILEEQDAPWKIG